MKAILDLGCGKNKKYGAVGVDFNDAIDTDIVHDLNKFPYPIQDSEFDLIYIDNVLEHLDDIISVMEEVHRVCKPNGTVKITVPYFRSRWAYIDPTHRHYFTSQSFAYYDPAHLFFDRYSYTRSACFRVKKVIFNEGLKNSIFKKCILLLANKYTDLYEYYFSHLYPLDDITFYLERLSNE